MMVDKQSECIRRWGIVGISSLAMILVAAVADSDPNWARLRAMPIEQRTKLFQGLRKFDLELSPDQQKTVRDIDGRIAQLNPQERARYLWVLRRYHDWFNSLPENLQEDLLAQPVDQRLARVRKLAAQHPVPTSDTPEFVRIAEIGQLTPFELASAFRIWEKLTPAQRTKVERIGPGHRRAELFKAGRSLKPAIAQETEPADFDETEWIARLETYWRKTRPVMLLENGSRKKAEDAENPSLDEMAKRKQEAIRGVYRRQSVNLYTSSKTVRSVDPENLARFVMALPPWIQGSIDQYPPDEAVRRLTWAYRLVFPPPEEIGDAHPATAAPAKGAPRTASKKTGATPAKPKPAASESSNAPY